jgi:phosphoribosylformylglycinamidine synthase
MASEEFSGEENKLPTVQVGDPFQEKLLLEASLELFETGAVIAAQDMGAAGLISSTIEMSEKGGYGIKIDLEKVPLRADGMEPWEILLSESQERMVFVLDVVDESILNIFKKWDLDCTEIGELTDTNNFVVTVKEKTVCDIPLKVLEPLELIRETKDRSEKHKQYFYPPQIITDFDMREVWEQYDSEVGGNTIKCFENVAIVRIPNSNKAIVMNTVANPYYCNYNPQLGVKSIIRNCYNNLAATGAAPLGLTNCLNFGNPENPEIMWEFTETIEGMKEVCEELKFPVVSGNVSFYNETDSQGIFPTPVIGGLGLIENYEKEHYD